MPKNKILILSNNPARASFRQRIGNYIFILKNRQIGAVLEKLPENILKRWKLFISAKDYDAVLLHKKCLNSFDSLILRNYAKKIIYDFDDAIMFSPNKPNSDRTSHYRLFKRTAKRADCMIAGNQYLAEHARKFCSTVFILPTGLDLSPFDNCRIQRSDDYIRLVWIGSKATLSYLAELKTILDQIGSQRPNVILRIIADDFFDLQNMKVEKVKWQLENQAGDLTICDIGIAPLPDNRFTRGKCGFKILQYFAAGLPVLASPVGINSDFINQSSAGILANNMHDFKSSILNMIDNIEMRKEMSQQGRAFVKQFDAQIIGENFYNLIKKAISNP